MVGDGHLGFFKIAGAAIEIQEIAALVVPVSDAGGAGPGVGRESSGCIVVEVQQEDPAGGQLDLQELAVADVLGVQGQA